MRSFAGTLLLEDIFDFIPEREAEMYSLARSIFNPNVLVVENDCKTTLGKFETVNYEAEGLVELATETRLSYERITTLLSSGVYSIATRHTSTCISAGGVCRKCYEATFPEANNTQPLDRVDVSAEYLANSEVIEYTPDVFFYQTKTDPGSYVRYYAFYNGTLLKANIDYKISEGLVSIFRILPAAGNIVIRFIKLDRSQFVAWLASTYSGSLLGLKVIPFQLLPMRPLFLASTLLENRLQSVSELIEGSSNVPAEYSKYIDSIRDPLEKALYMLALFSIYYNVTN